MDGVNVTNQEIGRAWALYNGDSAELLAGLPDESAHLSVFSPPFPGMYVYSDTERDLANCQTPAKFFEHYAYIMRELLRVMIPGRLCVVHIMPIPGMASMLNSGWNAGAGLWDFRGHMVNHMTEWGFEYRGEVTIDKNPQVEATRNKEHALLFKTLATDAARLRPALADYLLIFRRPGDNPIPIQAGAHETYNPTGGWVTQEDWIEWAAPVWYRAQPGMPRGIRQTDVLNVQAARDNSDERHLAPLQLGVIERVVKLYTNPSEIVLSPFAGVGSEGVVALRHGRRFVGIELKPSYWQTAAENLRAEEAQLTLGSVSADEETQ